MKSRQDQFSPDLLSNVIVDQAPDAILVLDLNLRIISVNEQACRLFGYEREELLKMGLTDLEGRMDAETVQTTLQHILEKGVAQFESLAVQKSGNRVPCEIKVCVTELGGIQYLIAFGRDISQRKKVAQALQEEKNLIDALIENIPDSIFFKDCNGRFFRVNQKLMNDLGLERIDQAIGKTETDLFGEEFGRRAMTVDREIIATGTPSIGQVEGRPMPNGQMNWMLTTKVPLFDAEGNVNGIAGVSREINEIKKNEDELRIKEYQLSMATQIAGLGYWELDVRKNLYTFNDQFYRVFRTSFEEIGSYQMSPEEYVERFLLPEDHGVVKSEIGKALASPDPKLNGQLEHRILFPDGSIGYISVNYFIVKDEDGNTIMTYGANQDITERKLAEKALSDSRAQLQVATQMAKLGYWEYDRSEDKLTVNDEFYRIFKTTAQEMGGYEMSLQCYAENFLWPEDRQYLVEESLMARETGEQNYHRYIEQRIRYATGEVGYMAVRFLQVRNDPYTAYKTIGVTQDITERKLVELTLKESEISLQRAFEIAAIGPCKYSVKDDRYEWTQRALDVIGFPPDQIPEDFASFLKFVHPDDVPKINEEVKRSAEVGVFDMEHRIFIDGKQKWMRFKSQVEFDAKGEAISTIGIVQDITDRKKAENELSEYRDHLEQLVQQRTNQLEDINRDLEAFAYSISHDLRAPLRHINGFSNLLIRKMNDPGQEVREYIGLINDASVRMGTMIDGLLHFSRLGRQKIHKKLVDLNKLLSEVISSFKPDMVHRDIEWRVGELPQVSGDYNLLKIAFENLISNAIKYTRNRPTAVIEIGTTSNNGSRHTIYFKDNGVGFDMLYADKLFGVFQRLHKEEEFEGTGIGLANVQQIIKKHGGMIRVMAHENEGATFYVTL